MGHIAEERIEILFDLAEKRFESEKPLSDRYVEIARNIGMRTNTSIPREYRERFCKGCGAYLKPGENCRVKIEAARGVKEVTCRECGEVNRHGLKET